MARPKGNENQHFEITLGDETIRVSKTRLEEYIRTYNRYRKSKGREPTCREELMHQWKLRGVR